RREHGELALERRALRRRELAGELAVAEDRVVREHARRRAEVAVEAREPRVAALARGGVRGKRARRARGLRVDVREDVRGVAQHGAVVEREHGHRRPAHAARRDARDHRKVRLLDVRHRPAVERPARLLAVVALRDREEARGQKSSCISTGPVPPPPPWSWWWW